LLLAKLAETPLKGSSLILSDRIPAGSAYIAGSSRLVNDPTFDVNTPTNAAGSEIADPFVAGDRLFWVVPAERFAAIINASRTGGQAVNNGVYGVTYRLSHTGALEMPEDRVAAIVVIPARSADGARGTRISANSPLGRLVGTGDLVVVQGSPDILNLLDQAIPFGGSTADTANTRPVGGAATRVRVRVENGSTDSIDNPQIVVEAFDADGLPASDEYATIESSVDIISPDAQPGVAGFQVRLENGVGYVRLQNLSNSASQQNFDPVALVKIEARVSNQNGVISSSQDFRITSNGLTAANPNPLQPTSINTSAVSRPVVGVGLFSIGGQFDPFTGNFTADGGLRYFLRGEVLAGLNVTLGINWQADYDPSRAVDPFRLSGSLLPPANPFERFPLKGDSSQLGSDIRSDEGFYLKLETGESYGLYGRFSPGFTGVLSSYNASYQGLQALVRPSAGFAVSGFIADAPTANQPRFRKQADSTDTYFLPAGINPDTERVMVATYRLPTNVTVTGDPCRDGVQKTELRRLNLTRGINYTIRYEVGILRLANGVPSTDVNNNINCIEVDYALGTVARDLRAGLQATLGGGGFNFTATALQYRNGSFGGNSSFLFGAGLGLRGGGFEAGIEAAYSGVFGTQSLGVAANLAFTSGNFQARVALQDRQPGFLDPNSGSDISGRNLTAGLVLGSSFAFEATLDHNQNYQNGTGSTGVGAQLRNDFGGGFTVGIGAAYLYSFPTDRNQLWATASANVPLGFIRLGLLQQVPLIGDTTTYGSTTVSLELPINKNFSVLLRDKLTYEWNGVRQNISFGVQGAFSNGELLRNLFGNESVVPSAFGQTNVFATYDLDTVNGDAGRARVGLATTIPLSDVFSVQLGADVNLTPNASEPRAGINLGALYSDSSVKANARAQFSFLPTGTKQVYTAGLIAQLGEQFTISPQIEYAYDPSLWSNPGATFADGGTFSIAFAYRGNNWSILSNNTAKFGVYRGTGATATDLLEGEFQFGYQASEVTFWRAGVAYRLPFQAGAFTIQLSSGITQFVSDSFAIGAQGAINFQPGTGTIGGAFGIEGSLRLVDNLLFTVGYNFVGINNAIGNTFRPGVYFRLDWKLDERTFGWR
jgi:hypothetical protein